MIALDWGLCWVGFWVIFRACSFCWSFSIYQFQHTLGKYYLTDVCILLGTYVARTVHNLRPIAIKNDLILLVGIKDSLQLGKDSLQLGKDSLHCIKNSLDQIKK